MKLVSLLIAAALLGFSGAHNPDPQDLVGTWRVDLRPTPDSEPYYQDMVIRRVADGTIEGLFYGSGIMMSEINTRWDGVRFAFVTMGGADRYVTMGHLMENGSMRGSTFSPDRGLLQPWTAVRVEAAEDD